MNLFSPEALRDRLGSRLKLLGGGARDLPARQQTLRATIEWSYQLLEPAEQRLFELLAVFAGCSVEAVEAVATGLDEAAGLELDALDGLSSLLDKSLVRQAETTIRRAGAADRHARDDPGVCRRSGSTSRPEFAAAAREHHARYFVEFAKAVAQDAADLGASAANDPVALEADNLRMAWRHGVAEGDLDQLKVLKGVLWPLYDRRGWYHSTVEVIRDMLGVIVALPDRADHWQEELTLRTSLARALTLLRGYTGEAEDAYVEALALFQDHPDVPLLFPVLRSLASFHGFRGELEKGIEYANRILQLAETDGDPSLRVDGYFLLGSDSGFSGRLAEGLGHLDEAIAVFESEAYRPRRLPARARCARVVPDDVGLLPVAARARPDEAVARADRASRAGHRARPPVLARVRAVPLRVPASLASRAGARGGAGDGRDPHRGGERHPDLARPRDVPARRRDERARPADRGPAPDRRRPRPVPGSADAAGLLAHAPVHPGSGPRRRRVAGSRVRADRRGHRAGRTGRPDGAAVPRRPRRPGVARPERGSWPKPPRRTSSRTRWPSGSARRCRSSGRRPGCAGSRRRSPGPRPSSGSAPSTPRSPRGTRRRIFVEAAELLS